MVERYGFKTGDYPVCEYVSARTIALPFFTRMSEYQIGRVCDTLEKVLERALVARKPRF
jgi:perosamine synthetase